MPRKPTPKEAKEMADRMKRNVEMFEGLKRKAQETPIEDIEKKFPEELFRAMYESFLIMQRGLKPRASHEKKLQTIEFFLGFLRDKKSLEALSVLRNMGLKQEKGEKKKPKVKWSGKKEK